MTCKDAKRRCGMTLIEVLIATSVITIAATGALSYEYCGAREMRTAKAYAEAVRISHFLLEDWKANGGSALYARASASVHNPVKLNMGFTYDQIDDLYKIDVDNIHMRIKLLRIVEEGRPILITARMRWRNDFVDGDIADNDPIVELTTCARADQMGG